MPGDGTWRSWEKRKTLRKDKNPSGRKDYHVKRNPEIKGVRGRTKGGEKRGTSSKIVGKMALSAGRLVPGESWPSSSTITLKNLRGVESGNRYNYWAGDVEVKGWWWVHECYCCLHEEEACFLDRKIGSHPGVSAMRGRSAVSRRIERGQRLGGR